MGRLRQRGACLALAVVVAVGVSGCLQNPNNSTASGGGDWVADGGSTDGDKKVTIFGAFGGDEKAAFEASLAKFEQETGIDIEYSNSDDFTTLIKTKIRSGDTPDIALYPQPGGLLEAAADKRIQPIDSYLDYDSLDSSLVPGFLEAARYNGRVYGAPMRMAVKSIVWYPASYTSLGLNTSPQTMQELATVSDQVKATGTAPWCLGVESDAATGWPATDWIEEIVLRMHGPDVYDQWTSHQIPFNDPRIVAAFEEFGKLALTDGNVYGGTQGILATNFGTTMNPAFETPPKCYFMRQGNFVASMLPTTVQADLDNAVGTFAYPPYDGGYEGKPMLGGGDIAALFNGNDEDSIAVMKFLTSDQFGAEWAQVGGWLSPHKTFDMNNYPNQTTRTIAEMATSATVFRYDGSDLMPNAVGGGSFWTGMVDFLSGTKTAEQVTTEIENSWPK
ncbi:MAG: ABC transporter substrate-binding protein [Propionibacteriaceae bacterium]|nr:ABC transporter substrate-binding protein [Propionibacteriaceae bacterium]